MIFAAVSRLYIICPLFLTSELYYNFNWLNMSYGVVNNLVINLYYLQYLQVNVLFD